MLKKLRISPLLMLMVAVMIFLGKSYECFVYVITVVMHELSHAVVAERLGFKLCNMRLTPYGASLTGEFEGARRSDEIIIALAGPACNLFIAIFFIALWWLNPVIYLATDTLVWVNFFTAAFNFLPVFPMDGGRIALAFLSKYIKRQTVYKYLRISGFIFCALFVALFIATAVLYNFNPTYLLVAVFMLVSTIIPDKNSKYRRLYDMAFRSERVRKGMLVREVIIFYDATLISLIKQINSGYYYKFVAVDGGFNVVSTVTETELERLLLNNAPQTKLCDALRLGKR